MLVKVKFFESEVFYKTDLNEDELLELEYNLSNIDFKDIRFYLDNRFIIVDNYNNEYDYIISLLDAQYIYLSEHSKSDKIESLEMLISKRDYLANTILEMFDICKQTSPVSLGSFQIDPWTHTDISWVNKTKENIILFFAKENNRKELLL